MDTFKARRAPDDAKQLSEFVSQQFREVEQASRRGSTRVPMNYLAVLPDKPQNGLYLFDADVVSGGAARGAYRYDEDSASYTFIA